MIKYLLANILVDGGGNQSPHITNKFTRPGGTMIIRPLTADLIVAAVGGGGVAVFEFLVEGAVQVTEAEAKSEAKAVDLNILMTHRASSFRS